MRSRANSGPHFHLAGFPRFTCKWREKRRGWDSNPRDDLTPPTRFPIALLRPTRTPLRGDGQESTKKRTSCYRSSPSGLRDLWSSRCSSPFHRTQYEERDLTLRLPLVVIVGRIHLYHLLPEAGFILRICYFGLDLHLTVSDL